MLLDHEALIENDGSIEALEQQVLEAPQQSGVEVYSLPLVDSKCTVGDISQLSPRHREIAIRFAAELYGYLGYMVPGGVETLIQADLERALLDDGEGDLRRRVKHILLTQGEGESEVPQAYVRLVPSEADLEAPFDPCSFPTGCLFEEGVAFGFEGDSEKQGLTNGQALELSRLVSASEAHRLAKEWTKEAGDSGASISPDKEAFLRKYLSEESLVKYGLVKSQAENKSCLAKGVNRTRRQAGMMLLMLAIDRHLRDSRPEVKELIGNLDGQAAGAFLSCRGGIEFERGTGEVDWDSADVAGCFGPYMKNHEGEITPFHFDPRHAINNADGAAGRLMRGARPLLRKEVKEGRIFESP